MVQSHRRATIVDVARHAGVSTKTVSRVLNGQPHVTEDIIRKVKDAAAAVDYHPNMMARALVQRRSHLIGLVYENPSPSYVVDLQKGVLERLRDEHYRLVVIPIASISQHEADVVGLLRSAALDGVVLAPPASDSARIMQDLTTAGIRFARIAPTRLIEAGPSNLIDDVSAAREIAEHVIRLGHRDIAVISGDPTHASADARMQGFRQAFAAAGVPLPAHRIATGYYTYESGHAAARTLLARRDRPTAILAQNDDMAVGALIATLESGLTVPGDLSITGFDDSEVARITWPAITTVRQPVFDMAVAAADMVVAQLQDTAPLMCRSHRHELIVRQSTGPCPA
ncbi:LacI family transcriptional regulator [Sphingomonas metalli]|uniref:LacI family transcriptional regulator n=1 Tax=Sphingomonas metalli TaxID=1779358 RepID=A0A916WQR0_9SPHN|nr:LacI family DNA-binding transcriptional regulator [Sphingomonas metalli]GGB20873.1 LacI family transcriptional regulator [Sphingomonas metalli]